MRLRDIMRTRVETISPRQSAQIALDRMRRARIRHLVVQVGQKIVGVLSDRDIAALGSMRQVETVEDVMSQPVLASSPDTTLRQAANLLRGRTIGCLPVVEEGKIVGIVTATDLLELLGAGMDRPNPKTRRRVLKERGPRHLPVVGRGRTVRLPAPR
jgi:acetoin utilization protein AcuB